MGWNLEDGPVAEDPLGGHHDKGVDLLALIQDGGVIDSDLRLARTHIHEVGPVGFVPRGRENVSLMGEGLRLEPVFSEHGITIHDEKGYCKWWWVCYEGGRKENFNWLETSS
jgi:hypothetical protein